MTGVAAAGSRAVSCAADGSAVWWDPRPAAPAAAAGASGAPDHSRAISLGAPQVLVNWRLRKF